MTVNTVVNSINQRTQVGVETTAGTPVACTKELLALSFEIGAKAETLKFRPTGRKFHTIVVPNKEWVEAKVSGVATYNEIVYPLSMILGYTAPVQQGGTTAYKWTFAPSATAADPVKTLTAQQGSDVRAQQLARLTMRDFGVSFSRDGLELSGAAFGNSLSDGVQMSTNEVQQVAVTGGTPASGGFRLTYSGQQSGTIQYNAAAAAVQSALEALSNIAPGDVICTGGNLPGTPVSVEFRGTLRQTDVAIMTASDTFSPGGDITVTEATKGVAPTSLDLEPILPEDVDVYVADTQAELDAAEALTGLFKIDWAINNKQGPIFLLRSAYGRGFGKVAETEPDATLAVEQEADEEGMAWLTTLRAGGKKYIRIQSIGDIVAGTIPYSFKLDMCVSVDQPNDFGDNQGLRTSPFNLVAVSDPAWGNKAFQVEIVNEMSSL